MSCIEDFFLNRQIIRRELTRKIRDDSEVDIDARHALESQSGLYSLKTWLRKYGVVQGFTDSIRVELATLIMNHVPELRAPVNPSEILERHKAVVALVTPVIPPRKGGKLRDATSLSSKLLWLLHPDVIPIIDANAWKATTVIARLLSKSSLKPKTTKYERFLQLHTACFEPIYAQLDAIIGEEFGDIYDTATHNAKVALKDEARRQYANHITVIDQLLWYLGAGA